MAEPSIIDLVECAKRELALRQRVYPKWVASGRLDARKADHEIECMKAIVSRLEKIRDDETGQPTLF
jgi:hypothetical protein